MSKASSSTRTPMATSDTSFRTPQSSSKPLNESANISVTDAGSALSSRSASPAPADKELRQLESVSAHHTRCHGRGRQDVQIVLTACGYNRENVAVAETDISDASMMRSANLGQAPNTQSAERHPSEAEHPKHNPISTTANPNICIPRHYNSTPTHDTHRPRSPQLAIPASCIDLQNAQIRLRKLLVSKRDLDAALEAELEAWRSALGRCRSGDSSRSSNSNSSSENTCAQAEIYTAADDACVEGDGTCRPNTSGGCGSGSGRIPTLTRYADSDADEDGNDDDEDDDDGIFRKLALRALLCTSLNVGVWAAGLDLGGYSAAMGVFMGWCAKPIPSSPSQSSLCVVMFSMVFHYRHQSDINATKPQSFQAIKPSSLQSLESPPSALGVPGAGSRPDKKESNLERINKRSPRCTFERRQEKAPESAKTGGAGPGTAP
ncbi:hypothetical protein EJ05DRAFT_504493 [Pseudovirgaria hyperparasitica]|uniref:Uncharacterized protein n=1 Tax=Pseudovirgaria hyperparasitica TaxID=470096 RepID=A0A6A6VUJ8_9PEZI|nr:uncharacterized protein EJ05DRAFT_504493 [Pseudovirgaria hyperparasitica]KAF2753893.1 hypothetical protein EJ05DRAFT_504493 [Pseudovirgaria hyperparasitica]